MTYVEQIALLPTDQARAARQLLGQVDDRLVADAVHADVPERIVSYLSGLPVAQIHAVTDAIDAQDREIVASLAVDR